MRTLGWRSLDAMLDGMSGEEFGLWLAEFQRAPWDDLRADLRAGVVAATVANAFGGRKDKKPFRPSDFMPYLSAQPTRNDAASADELRAFFEPKT